MHVVEINTGVTGYPALLAHVLRHGEPRVSRGLRTLDAGPTTVVMHDPTAPLPLGTGRGVNRSIAAAEALQLVGAFSDPDLLPASFDRYRERDGSFWGAYGTRIGGQLGRQLDKLRDDPGGRQAVITLWVPECDNEPGHPDYPCTVALLLWLERDRLQLSTVMRSQDCWLGTPYDWTQFVQLQWTAATLLGVEPGIYRHTTNSTHLYERDVENARTLVSTWYAPGGPAEAEREWQPRGIGRPGDSFADVIGRAERLRFGQILADPTPSEEWYARQLVRRSDS